MSAVTDTENWPPPNSAGDEQKATGREGTILPRGRCALHAARLD
jgi:hypothetical protein